MGEHIQNPTFNKLMDDAKKKEFEVVLPVGNLKAQSHKGLYIAVKKGKKTVEAEPVKKKECVEAAAVRLRKRLDGEGFFK